MNLAIFDLDNTLLSADSDFLWGQFLVKKKRVDADYYVQKNQFFYDEYKHGRLIIEEFLEFSLKPLAQIPMQDLQSLHQDFMQEEIIPHIGAKAKALIAQHKKKQDYCLIITATNLFVTEKIAQFLKMDDIIATIPEIKHGQYTGKVEGQPSFQQGKITRLKQWLVNHPQLSLHNSYFYSDSINDLPLLEQVTFPIAVDPDEKLKKVATQKNWPIMSLGLG